MNEEEIKSAKLYALRRLNSQAMLSKNLADALVDRGYCPETVDFVIGELTRLQYLNDDEWMESYLRVQMARKVGPHLIRGKLAEKGISNEKISALLEGLEEEKQKETILALLSSKYQKRNVNDYKERQKVIASLARRGFDLSLILSCLRDR